MIQKLKTKVMVAFDSAKNIIKDDRGESDSVGMIAKILISVVIGALALTALYALFGDTVIPKLTEKITAMFDYAG